MVNKILLALKLTELDLELYRPPLGVRGGGGGDQNKENWRCKLHFVEIFWIANLNGHINT